MLFSNLEDIFFVLLILILIKKKLEKWSNVINELLHRGNLIYQIYLFTSFILY